VTGVVNEQMATDKQREGGEGGPETEAEGRGPTRLEEEGTKNLGGEEAALECSRKWPVFRDGMWNVVLAVWQGDPARLQASNG